MSTGTIPMLTDPHPHDMATPWEEFNQWLPSTQLSKELATSMLAHLSSGRTLTAWMNENGIHAMLPYRWADRNPVFKAAWATAKGKGHDRMLDQCVEIADDLSDSPRSREVRVGTRLKVLAVSDSRFAERQHIEHGGSVQQLVVVTNVPERIETIKPVITVTHADRDLLD
ncbi:MAG: hypothetical protein DRJ50_14945 [Actinobacteria bacterium]|nr:MAG: hypothetical protein DRJ50_14945 [Actinomycetota bacterium]